MLLGNDTNKGGLVKSTNQRQRGLNIEVMSDGGDEPVGTFAIHFAEGDMLFKQCQYAKAIDSYTKVCVTLYLQYLSVLVDG